MLPIPRMPTVGPLLPMIGQSVRYSMVGAICACANNLIIIGANLAGIDDRLALALTVLTVTPLGYVLQSWFTYGAPLSIRRFMRFLGGIAVGTLWFVLLMTLFQRIIGMPVWIASPLTTILVFVWNFAASRWAIRSERRERKMPADRAIRRLSAEPAGPRGTGPALVGATTST